MVPHKKRESAVVPRNDEAGIDGSSTFHVIFAFWANVPAFPPCPAFPPIESVQTINYNE